MGDGGPMTMMNKMMAGMDKGAAPMQQMMATCMGMCHEMLGAIRQTNALCSRRPRGHRLGGHAADRRADDRRHGKFDVAHRTGDSRELCACQRPTGACCECDATARGHKTEALVG